MTFHVWTVVRNEAYLLPHFLRHYAPLADRVFVVDDHSDDGTREIARAHDKVTLLDYPVSTGLDDEAIGQVYREHIARHSKGEADWVACPDADEFLVHPNLRGVLFQMAGGGGSVNAIGSTGWLCGAANQPLLPDPLYQQCPYRKRSRKYSKTLILNPEVSWTFSRGRHETYLETGQVAHADVQLYHCCYLGLDYTLNRIKRNYSRVPASRNLPPVEYRLRRASWEIRGRMLRERMGWEKVSG